MKLKLGVLFLTVVLVGCIWGGTKGSIARYKFHEINREDLEQAVNYVITNYNYELKTDTIYSLEGTGYENIFNNIIITHSGILYILQYSYSKKVNGSSTIALTGGAVHGETVVFPKKLSWITRRKYKKIFERYVIDEISKILKKEPVLC